MMQTITKNTNIQYMKGVGPKMAVKLNKLGIETIQDLIFYYPRRYLDFTKITPVKDVISTPRGQSWAEKSYDEGAVTIKGRILEISNKKTSRRRFTVTEAIVEDETGNIKVVWFNQPFLTKMMPAGREVVLNGKINFNFYTREVVMESPMRTLFPKIEPIYGETAGLTSRYISKLVASIKNQIESIEEWLPLEITNHKSQITNKFQINNLKIPNHKTIEQFSNCDLLGIKEALLNIHFPKNAETLERARRRIAFDELFMISLQANLSKAEIKKEKAPAILSPKFTIVKFGDNLPFKLTNDQKKATIQILNDLKKTTPMNRLLNGDVGSGKTVVAAIAALVVVQAGYRVVVMAPTSILANQHYETFCKLFEKEKISIGLYTRESQISNIKSQNNNSKSKTNKLDSKFKILNSNVIIGTQALIQEGVELENLGLVVVDEQHRFGVKQRAALNRYTSYAIRHTGEKMRPHFLSMTATPIPRTLHLALFGDLDISVIKEKPADRKDIKTRLVEPHNRDKAYEFVRQHIKAGRQAFVICPLIESKEEEEAPDVILSQAKNPRDPSAMPQDDNLSLFDLDRKSVKFEYEKLQTIYPEYKIGMLHGRLKAKEKDSVMAEFSSNKTQILVSTSVVEVGVDIPNATIMVVEDAERFGLAQIHQFRGRVGRAEHQSFCFLFSSTMSEKAIRRLKALEATSDGFKLAEIDLEQRGPGAVFGTEQSGMLDLKMASFSDRELIEEASSAAKSIVASDPELKNHPVLKDKVSDYLTSKHME